ncbi:Ig-like domain-containing protein [Candidatus Poribacteria bacterium]
MRRTLCLIPAIALLMTVSGCENEDGQETGPPPEVLSVSVAGTWELPSAAGWDVPSNASITVAFSKEMETESVVIYLNSIPVFATLQDNRTFIFAPETEGEYELVITGKDTFGQALDPPYSPISFAVTESDTIPPYIVDDECRPRNGEEMVDPGLYTEKFTIAFSEPMAEVELAATNLEYLLTDKELVTYELSTDSKAFNIILGRYSPPNECTHFFELTGRDLAGNELRRTEYSFTTADLETFRKERNRQFILSISMNEVMELEPFQEITFRFDLDVKLKIPLVIMGVSGVDLVAEQVTLNGNTYTQLHEWLCDGLFLYKDDEWHCDKDDPWRTVVLEFQEKHLNPNGENILTTSAKEGAMKVCNIVVTTEEVFWL